MLTALLLALFVANVVDVESAKWTDPLWHSYTPIPDGFKQSDFYTSLTGAPQIGSPIFFSASNTSANYRDYTWFNPCYIRALNNSATYVAFWYVGNDAYCSIHATSSTSALKQTPPFPQANLARVEILKTRCED